MEECKITLFRDKETLTKEQVDHVYEVLNKWNIIEVEEVEYSPKYDWISISGPVLKYGLTKLIIRDQGTRITNQWQLDHYDLVMTLGDPTARSSTAEKLQKKKKKNYRDEPYVLRERVPLQKSNE